MKKLTVLAYNSDADAIMRRLMRLRCVDLRAVEGLDGERHPTRFGEDAARTEAEARLAKINRAIPILAKYSMRKKANGSLHMIDADAFVHEGRDRRAMETVEETLSLQARNEFLLTEQTREWNLAASLSPWAEYDAPLNVAGSAKTVMMYVSSGQAMLPSETRAALGEAGAYLELVSNDAKSCYFVLTCCKEDEEAVNRVLALNACNKLSFPQIDTTARVAVDDAHERLKAIDAEFLRNEERIRDLSQGLDEVEILHDIESTTAEIGRQKRKLALTRRCAVIQGWIPAEKQEQTVKALSEFSCACEISEPTEDDEPPVLLKNNAFAANFEWVIGMYSYPKYGTFDPSMIMGIFYFLLFGMMFADVGYGLLLVLGCIAGIKLLHPKEGLKRTLSMFAWCGLSSMFMGVLFGGWFGDLPTAIMDNFIYKQTGAAIQTPLGDFFANGLLFNPINEPVAFLVAGLAMGEIHLVAGMAINMIQTCKSGKVLQGICSTVPFWVLFLGLDLMAPVGVASMMGLQPSPEASAILSTLSSIGGYIAIAGAAGILFLKGVGSKGFMPWLISGLGGLYSLISYASDLLSYSRILALGLAAGVISQVINMMTGLGASGPVGFIVMLIVMILGHVLNIAINILGTFVHAARLQYIEFFGKFYEDGGQPFTPMLPTEQYSEDINSVSK